MNSLRTLLVHVDGTAAATTRLGLAFELARGHDAALDVGFAVAPRFLPLPLPVADGIPSAPLLQEVDDRHRRHALASFERVCHGAPHVRWLDLSGTDAAHRLIRHARLTDCVVLGQPDRESASGCDVPAHFAESVLLSAGVPALVVPQVGKAGPVPGSVLVAWKSSRESARALAGALPLLSQAREVHVAVASGSDAGDRENLLTFLAAHGVANVRIQAVVPDAAAGDSLLSLASDIGADLLVMGCYGHSRAREWVAGGATRTVLASMTLPVWMVH